MPLTGANRALQQEAGERAGKPEGLSSSRCEGPEMVAPAPVRRSHEAGCCRFLWIAEKVASIRAWY
jgi:hypothetical protein